MDSTTKTQTHECSGESCPCYDTIRLIRMARARAERINDKAEVEAYALRASMREYRRQKGEL